jgi:hypothetical protein
VHLKEFSLVSPKIKSTEIFKAIEMAIPATAIEQAITKTKVEEKRHRALPAQLVVCLVIAMSLWSKDSRRDVLKNFGVAELQYESLWDWNILKFEVVAQ